MEEKRKEMGRRVMRRKRKERTRRRKGRKCNTCFQNILGLHQLNGARLDDQPTPKRGPSSRVTLALSCCQPPPAQPSPHLWFGVTEGLWPWTTCLCLPDPGMRDPHSQMSSGPGGLRFWSRS